MTRQRSLSNSVLAILVAFELAQNTAAAQEKSPEWPPHTTNGPQQRVEKEPNCDPLSLDGVDDPELDTCDLVFIRTSTDKTQYEEGEDIILSLQLWRIRTRSVASGPYRGARIQEPNLNDFTVVDEDASQRIEKFEGQSYDVWERRQSLRPNQGGILTIGPWHWEGIALVNQEDIPQRLKYYYQLETEPIEITVAAASQSKD